jgi:hypothetical protein
MGGVPLWWGVVADPVAPSMQIRKKLLQKTYWGLALIRLMRYTDMKLLEGT